MKGAKYYHKVLEYVTPFLIFHHAIVKREVTKKCGNKTTILTDILSTVLTLFLLSTSVLVLSTCALYKSLIYIYLRLRHGSRLQGLITGCDLLTTLADGCEGPINALTQVSTDKHFNAMELYGAICARMHDRFFLTEVDRKLFSTREYTRFGYYYFLETFGVQVEDIVKFIKAPGKSLDEPINRDELMRLAQQYYNSDMPVNNKFNWDICLCLNPLIAPNNVEGKTHFVIFTRMHHSLGDGLVIYNITANNLFQPGPDFKAYTENLLAKCKNVEKRKTYTHMYKYGNKVLIDKPCLLRDGKRHKRSIYASRNEEPSEKTYFTKMKAIRQKFPGVVTFNILMTAYSASLADYYLKHSPVDLEIPEYIKTTHPVQLNLKRYLDTYSSSNKIKLINEVSSYLFACPIIPKGKRGIPVKDYLVERMLELRDEFQKCFQSFDIQGNYIWTGIYFSVLPYQVICNLFHGIYMQTLSSCLPGGPKLNLFNDDPIEDISYFISRQYYSTLLLSVNSYDNRLQVGITADEERFDSLSKLNEICDGIFTHLDLLYEQCMSYEDATI